MIVEMFRLSFLAFMYAFYPESSSFFRLDFLFLYLFLCYSYNGTFPFHMVYFNVLIDIVFQAIMKKIKVILILNTKQVNTNS